MVRAVTVRASSLAPLGPGAGGGRLAQDVSDAVVEDQASPAVSGYGEGMAGLSEHPELRRERNRPADTELSSSHDAGPPGVR